VTISGDSRPVGMEQLLINLVHNAADAVLECGSQASVGWSSHDSQLDVWVRDDGPGIQNTANVFVPLLYHQAGRHGNRLGASGRLRKRMVGRYAGESTRDARMRGAIAFCRDRPLPPHLFCKMHILEDLGSFYCVTADSTGVR